MINALQADGLGERKAQESCRVFWGSHGCEMKRGHLDRGSRLHHQCSCGARVSVDDSRLFGEDAPS